MIDKMERKEKVIYNLSMGCSILCLLSTLIRINIKHKQSKDISVEFVGEEIDHCQEMVLEPDSMPTIELIASPASAGAIWSFTTTQSTGYRANNGDVYNLNSRRYRHADSADTEVIGILNNEIIKFNNK